MHLLRYYFWITIFGAVAVGMLSACGHKGALYLPDKEAEAPPVSMTPTTPPAAVTTKEEEIE